jgi:DNA polymerase epsilon subunit 1
MFRGAKVKTNRRWDMVHIRPTKIAGRFVLWLRVDAELVPVPLRIPREFYIHTRTLPNQGSSASNLYTAKKVVRGLPLGAACVNLFKITAREDVYEECYEQFIDLTNDPNVDGIY